MERAMRGVVKAANEYVNKQVAENGGSYFGWNADDMAIAKAAFIAGVDWGFVAGVEWARKQVATEYRKTGDVEEKI